MKSCKTAKALVALLFGILIVGCAAGGTPGRESDRVKQLRRELDSARQISADLGAEGDRIGREEGLWKENSLKYKQDLEGWEKDMKACNKREINTIKDMSNKQLEIYSKYEESIKNNILAKAELSLRKLKASLTDEQKNELFNIFEIAESLESRRKELNKKQVELTERKQKIVNDTVRHEERSRDFMRYLSMRATQLGGTPPSLPSSHMLNAVQQSLRDWQQSHQQQQQRMQTYSTNQSLRDIAAAIRGY